MPRQALLTDAAPICPPDFAEGTPPPRPLILVAVDGRPAT